MHTCFLALRAVVCSATKRMEDEYSSFEEAIWNPSALQQSGLWPVLESFGDAEPVRAEQPSSLAGGERESVADIRISPPDRRIPPGNGRLANACFFLTYSQSGYDKEKVASFLRAKGTIKRMIVANETHEDGGRHVHALVEFDRRKDVRPNFFDIGTEHPNIGIWGCRGAQTFDSWFVNHWDYCCKEDLSPITIGTRPSVERKRKRDEVFKTAVELAKTTSVESAMHYLLENATYETVTKYQNVAGAMHVIRLKANQVVNPPRGLDSFKNVPDIPANWRNMFLTGPTNYGKTQLARALLPEATVVSHRNQLTLCDFSKGIIFDDFDVSHWPPAAVIHLLDWDEPRGIDVKHGHVIIPPKTRKIVTFNRELWEWAPKECPSSQFDAIKRRISEVRVEEKLY